MNNKPQLLLYVLVLAIVIASSANRRKADRQLNARLDSLGAVVEWQQDSLDSLRSNWCALLDENQFLRAMPCQTQN